MHLTYEVDLAMRLRAGLKDKGWDFLVDSPTNQQFPILPESVLGTLSGDFGFSRWQSMGGGMTAVRFCTGWAAAEEQIDALLARIPEKQP